MTHPHPFSSASPPFDADADAAAVATADGEGDKEALGPSASAADLGFDSTQPVRFSSLESEWASAAATRAEELSCVLNRNPSVGATA